MIATSSQIQQAAPQAEIVQRIHQRIRQRAGYGATELRIDALPGRIEVRGIVRSYYVWQLVFAACRDALAGQKETSLDVAMTVLSNDVCQS